MAQAVDNRARLALTALVVVVGLILVVLRPSGNSEDPAPGGGAETGTAAEPRPGPPEQHGLLLVTRRPGPREIRGRVVTAAGEPAAGAWVRIVPRASGTAFAVSELSDDEGMLDFGLALHPQYRVTIEGGNGYPMDLEAGIFEVPEGGAEIEIRLPNTRIRGSVLEAPDFRPEVHVAATVLVDLLVGDRLATRARVAEGGTWAVHGVAPGRYRLRAAGRGFRDFEGEVEIRKGEPVPFDLPLEPVPPTELLVRVRDEAGEPVGRAVVTLASREARREYVLARGEEPGSFVVEGVVPGTWGLRVVARGFWWEDRTIQVPEADRYEHVVTLRPWEWRRGR